MQLCLLHAEYDYQSSFRLVNFSADIHENEVADENYPNTSTV